MTFMVIRLQGEKETKPDHQGLLTVVSPAVFAMHMDRLTGGMDLALSPGASRAGNKVLSVNS